MVGASEGAIELLGDGVLALESVASFRLRRRLAKVKKWNRT